MKHISYTPKGVCSKQIDFDLSDNFEIYNLTFTGGCNGNLKAISKLLEGKKADEIIPILEGNVCGVRNTSCADQLTKALKEAIESCK